MDLSGIYEVIEMARCRAFWTNVLTWVVLGLALLNFLFLVFAWKVLKKC